MALKPQRVRDPVHNLISFEIANEFEDTLWRVIQTPPFQRLRRIRQLGFSELVFPGATHTRFAHSLGVFHTARQLMEVIRKHIISDGRQPRDHRSQVALAAALVHDVGHGMFSHAFEQIGKKLNLPMAQHATVSELIIKNTEIADELNRALGPSFADEVAELVGREGPGSLYDAVVSSQFDADRLDYMQRDRLMTGVQSSGVDPVWLMANLEIESVKTGADNEQSGSVETLVLGPKAAQVAESYVLSLFHLYPNVYLHKATRGVEMLFSALVRTIVRLVKGGHTKSTGLTNNHPIIRFAKKPNDLQNAINLDDQIFWGCLPMLMEAKDETVRQLAKCIKERSLLKCIDIRREAEATIQRRTDENLDKYNGRISLACTNILQILEKSNQSSPDGEEKIFVDRYKREPYKRYQESETPLNRILIRSSSGTVRDMAEVSPVIAAAQPFEICRAYVFKGDTDHRSVVENIMRTEFQKGADGNA